MKMPGLENLKFKDSKSANGNFICVQVDIAKILQSWRLSVFSYEWMMPDDQIKVMDALSETEQLKRQTVEAALAAGEPLDKPVLGIGIQDNVEIGSGRAVMLTLAAQGLKTIPVHIPKSNAADFEAFLAEQDSRPAQSGNVLFYILIAVGLLAALSFAVSQSGQGGADIINEDRAKLIASEILEYGNTIGNAVSQLELRGVEETELCFDHDDWGANNYDHAGCTDNFNRVFHVSGAGLVWQNAPTEAMDSSASPDNLWHIYGDNAVQDIGTTCSAASCADLVLVVDELKLLICQQINGLLDVTDADATPPTDTDIGETRYIGAFGYTASIGDEAGGAALAGQSTGCFQNTTDNRYTFYKVLIAR